MRDRAPRSLGQFGRFRSYPLHRRVLADLCTPVRGFSVLFALSAHQNAKVGKGDPRHERPTDLTGTCWIGEVEEKRADQLTTDAQDGEGQDAEVLDDQSGESDVDDPDHSPGVDPPWP